MDREHGRADTVPSVEANWLRLYGGGASTGIPRSIQWFILIESIGSRDDVCSFRMCVFPCKVNGHLIDSRPYYRGRPAVHSLAVHHDACN